MEADTAWDSLFTGRTESSLINLTIGAPGPSILAKLPGLFQTASSHRLSSNLGSLFQYGPEVGIKRYRVELSKFLTQRYGEVVGEDELVLTCGATNGLHLATSCLIQHGGTVFVEDPTYFIAMSLLCGDMGLNVVPIRMTEEGIDLDHLQEMIAEKSACNPQNDDRFWGMIYTIPTYHNPTGITFSRHTSMKMIEIAKSAGLMIFCDDVYNMLSYRPLEFSRLKSLDKKKDVVVSNGTFSKILAPGVRLGWIEAPIKIVKMLTNCGVLQSGGSQNNFVSGIVTSLLELGLVDKQLDMCKELYKKRMDNAVEILNLNLPCNWKVSHPHGGYFLWVTSDVDNLDEFCQWLGSSTRVAVLHGKKASPSTYLHQASKVNTERCIRISIAYYDLKEIEEGCRLLCDAINDYFHN